MRRTTLLNRTSGRKHIAEARFCAPISIVRATWWARGARAKSARVRITSDFAARKTSCCTSLADPQSWPYSEGKILRLTVFGNRSHAYHPPTEQSDLFSHPQGRKTPKQGTLADDYECQFM